MKTRVTIRAICKYEPRGDYGLEGYQLGEEYRVTIVTDDEGSYYRIYPGGSDRYYYETCKTGVFNKYFVVKRLPSDP